jgi:hypothetical protein
MDTVSFEDSIFILNMRVRMTRDTLRLNPPPELFLDKCLDDLEFINNTLISLSRILSENTNQNGKNGIIDLFLDIEWQFSQLLIEFLLDSSPFSLKTYTSIKEIINSLRDLSSSRRNDIEKTLILVDDIQAEPVISSAEISGLLGSK